MSAQIMPRSNRRPRSRLFLVILIGVVVLFLCAGEYLVIDSDPRPADLITVLSGNDSVNEEIGRASCRERV